MQPRANDTYEFQGQDDDKYLCISKSFTDYGVINCILQQVIDFCN